MNREREDVRLLERNMCRHVARRTGENNYNNNMFIGTCIIVIVDE